jgi:hypothetical protein
VKSIIEIERQATELADSFVNGNRTYVAREIATEGAPTAALLAAHVTYALKDDDEDRNRQCAVAFLIFLERERETQASRRR